MALDAIRGERTLSQLASQYHVHPVQIGQWRRTTLEQMAELFVDGRSRKRADPEGEKDALYEQIGRLKIVSGGAATTFVYDAVGNLAAEYATQPISPPCTTCYVKADYLGSTRLLTDSTGTVKKRYDFVPFGEESRRVSRRRSWRSGWVHHLEGQS